MKRPVRTCASAPRARACVEVVYPRAEVVQAAKQTDPPGALVEGDVPARLRHAAFQGEHRPRGLSSSDFSVTSVSVRFMARLKTVAPPSPGGAQVETTSSPRVRVEKSLMKNRKKASVRAEVMPSDRSSTRSSAARVKFCDRARRFATSTWK